MNAHRERIQMMGCTIDNLSMEETLETVEGFIDSGMPHQHVVVNVDKLVKAQRDPGLRQIINDCALINCDGMPVVWASRLLGKPLKERVAGVDLFDALMVRAAARGWRVYLLGATEAVVQEVRTRYSARFPQLVFAGCRNGYWSRNEELAVVADITRARADLLFVAISSPKKEQFLGTWQAAMRVPFAMGVGGSFDVAAGKVRRAPLWMQRCGLEWFFRFLQEPRRMFHRYFVEDMAFIGLMWREWRGSPDAAPQPQHEPAVARLHEDALPHSTATRAAVNIVISLDYEIYFGSHSGSALKTVVEPTEALARLARRFGVPLVFFVDALWLLKLREEAPRHPALMAEHYRVSQQLERLVRAGHELQLHLHPHWADSHWSGSGWQMDLRRYRLHAFDDAAISDMVARGAAALRALSGTSPVTAFRAGGWCIQPFERLRQPLLDAGITIDSTVFAGGQQRGDTHQFDFTDAPALSRWHFDDDPLRPQPGGRFLEVPIASHAVSPLWFWRLAAARTLGGAEHRALGEGSAVQPPRGELWRKLSRRTTSVVSIDGVKSGFLEAAWRRHSQRGSTDFVVIGHPKGLTPYSLQQFERFLTRHAEARFVGFNGYAALPSRQQAA